MKRKTIILIPLMFALLSCETNKITLKEVSSSGKGYNFHLSSSEEKGEIAGLLEEFVLNNHLSGITLTSIQSHCRFSDRVNINTAPLLDGYDNPIIINDTVKHRYTSELGFALLSDATLNDTKLNVDYPSYYHTPIFLFPEHMNEANLSYDSFIYENIDYLTSNYFIKVLSEDKQTIKHYPQLATKENVLSTNDFAPIPLKDGKEMENTTLKTKSNQYRIYVHTGEGYVYNSCSTNPLIKPFIGKTIQIEDYLTPYKNIHMQCYELDSATYHTSGLYAIKGLKEYYASTRNKFDKEAWDNVGIKTGSDEKGTYLEFTYNNELTPREVMGYAGDIYSPIPEEFLNTIGGMKNYGAYYNELTPVDTMLSVGPYVLEEFTNNRKIVFKNNNLFNKNIKEDRFNLSGVCFDFYNGHQELDKAYQDFLDNKLDYADIPETLEISEKNKKGVQAKGCAAPTRLNLNMLDKSSWEEKFGENGSIYQNKKEDYWDVKPAMSNYDFIKGLNLCIDRVDLANKTGSEPSIDTFLDYYYYGDDPYKKYNYSDYHKQALLSYYDNNKDLLSNYGFDLTLARSSFKKACDAFLNNNIYKNDETIEIEIAWYDHASMEKYGMLIESYMEKAFNHESVCNNKLSLDIINVHTNTFSNMYYDRVVRGRYDISFGKSSYSTSYVFGQFYSFESNNESGITYTYGTETNSSEILIEYKNKKFSFDALLEAVNSGTLVEEDGTKSVLADAILISDTLDKKNKCRNVEIKYVASNIDGEISYIIDNIEIYGKNENNGNMYTSILEYATINEDSIILSIPLEAIKEYYGEISYIVEFAFTIKGDDYHNFEYIYLDSAYPEHS